MDGNGRWAGRRGLPRTEGHTEGEENLARLVRIAVTRDIGWLTVFGFSTENWIRPRAEVRHILGLHAKLFGRVQELNELERADPVDRAPVRHTRRPHAEVRPAGDPQGDQRHGRQHRDAAHRGLRLRRPPGADRRRAADDGRGSRGDDRGHRRAPLPAGAAAGRRARAHVRRAAGLQLPALAERRRRRSTSRTRPGRSSTPPSSTPRSPSSRDCVPRPRRPLLATPSLALGRSQSPDRVALSLLADVTGELPGAEERPGQVEMADLVAAAIDSGRHLVVQAGTGTGKTLAYLVPAVTSGARVVVATATKALQDQLAGKDLPFLQSTLPVPFDWAVLKGRSNYVCLQRLREMHGGPDAQLELEGMTAGTLDEIRRIAEWVGTTDTGDGAELDWSPSRRRVAVGQRRQRRVPRRRSLPARRAVLRRAGPAAGGGRRRHRRQHPPLRAARRQRRRDPPRARRRRVRRGPRARGHHERHGRRPAGAGPVHHAGRHAAADPRRPRADRRRHRHRRRAARGHRSVRRPAAPQPLSRRDPRRRRRGPVAPRPGRRRPRRHPDARRGRQAAQAARPAAHRSGDRAPRPGARPR